jgi:hypothetical protein
VIKKVQNTVDVRSMASPAISCCHLNDDSISLLPDDLRLKGMYKVKHDRVRSSYFVCGLVLTPPLLLPTSDPMRLTTSEPPPPPLPSSPPPPCYHNTNMLTSYNKIRRCNF